MRIGKPASANNSPRNNLIQQRRQTMMNDPVFIHKTQQMLEQPCLPTRGPEAYGSSYYEPAKRAARPVSWHPSTQLPQAYQQQFQQQQQYPVSTQQSQYPFPGCCDYELYAPLQMPPTPAAYSAYSSPESAFSPTVLPSWNTYALPQQQQQQHYASPSWDMNAAPLMQAVAQVPTPPFSTDAASYAQAPTPSYAEPSHSPGSWTDVPAFGHSLSAPPTPEEPTNFQYAGAAMAKQEIAYSAPAEIKVEDEDEGDILIGLGLYDPPEALHGGLLGASFEPSGKGLKLEDAWEPPAEDEDEDDEDDDAESEEE